MSLLEDKKQIKKEIDKVEDRKVLDAIKTILDYSNLQTGTWDDEEFVNEMKARSADFKSGTSKKYTWQQTKTAARKNVKALSKKDA